MLYGNTAPTDKKHQVTLQNVQAGTDGSRTLTLSVAPNKLGVAEDKLLSVSIPDMNDFEVYDVTYVTEPERYVEVTFSKELDSSRICRDWPLSPGIPPRR